MDDSVRPWLSYAKDPERLASFYDPEENIFQVPASVP